MAAKKTKKIKAETPTERAMRLKAEADAARIIVTKEALLKALDFHKGNVTEACKACKISRETFYEYKRNDKEFAGKVNEIKEIVIDFVENKMFEIIEDKGKGAPGLIIWYLKTQARHRGYVEQDLGDPADAGKVTINVKFSKKKV